MSTPVAFTWFDKSGSGEQDREFPGDDVGEAAAVSRGWRWCGDEEEEAGSPNDFEDKGAPADETPAVSTLPETEGSVEGTSGAWDVETAVGVGVSEEGVCVGAGGVDAAVCRFGGGVSVGEVVHGSEESRDESSDVCKLNRIFTKRYLY